MARKQYDKVVESAQKVLDDEQTSQNDRLGGDALVEYDVEKFMHKF
jgi:hypothetical protein